MINTVFRTPACTVHARWVSLKIRVAAALPVLFINSFRVLIRIFVDRKHAVLKSPVFQQSTQSIVQYAKKSFERGHKPENRQITLFLYG